MTPQETIRENNMDTFERVAAVLGWVSQRDRETEGWNQFVIFNGKDGRRYSVNFHDNHYTVAGLTTTGFEKHGCYLSHQESGKLSDTTSKMSVNKSSEVLVKEIQRRVVAPYEKFFELMNKMVAQSQEYANKTAEQAVRVGNILDARVQGFTWDGQEFVQNKGEDIRLNKSFPDGLNLNVRFYGDSARWEYVSFPNDLHEKLCRVIADHFKRSE